MILLNRLGIKILIGLIWLLTIYKSEINSIPADTFYYISALPFYFWIGLILLCGLIFLDLIKPKEESKTNKFILILLLCLYIFGTATFIETNGRTLDAYGHLSSSYGLINQYPNSYNQEYPGAFSFFSSILVISNLNPLLLIKFYPIVLILLLSSLFFIISSLFVRSRYQLLSPLIFISFAWFQEFHVSPQSLALILYLGFFYFFSSFYFNKKKYGLIVSLILISIVVSHPGTPIFVLVTLFPFFISEKITSKKSSQAGRVLRWFIIIWISWMIFIAQGNFNSIINFTEEAMQNAINNVGGISTDKAAYSKAITKISIASLAEKSKLEELNNYNFSEKYNITENFIPLKDSKLSIQDYAKGLYLAAKTNYWLPIQLRKISFVLEILLGLISIFYLIYKRIELGKVLILLGIFIGLIIWILLSIYNQAELIERPFLFMILPLTILLIALFENITQETAKGIILGSLLIMVLLLPLTRYANEPFEYVPDSNLAVCNFLINHLDGSANNVFMYHGGLLKLFNVRYLKKIEWNPELFKSQVIVYDTNYINILQIFYGKEINSINFQIESISSRYDKIYSSKINKAEVFIKSD